MKTRTLALITGISLLLMAVVAGYAYGFSYSSIVIVDNPSQTLTNINANWNVYIGGTLGWVLIFILDLMVTFGFWKFFNGVNRKTSAITAIFRLVYTFMLGIGISKLFIAIPSIQSGDEMQAYQEILGFESLWTAGLIVFGLHLIGLGVLACKAPQIHKVFAYLLTIAGLGYVVVSPLKLIYPGSESVILLENILSLPMAVGELAFAIWMIAKGGKTTR